ncbi:MAG: hypothetical protein AB7G25_06690 [Sphingomonadaceae bacterium]
MSGFDPAAWLQEYEELGGWYIVDAEGHVAMGWTLEGDGNNPLELQRLFMEAKRTPEHRSALIAHILARQRIPA